MENNNETKRTYIDDGNYNIKYIGENGNGIFSSEISREHQAYPEAFDSIIMENGMNTTYIGTGSLPREFNKTSRDFLPQIMFAISRANKEDTIETKLVLLLPIIQMENKSKFIDTLQNQDFTFKYNGKDRLVSVKDVLVLPEGYVSYFTLSPEQKQGSVCIIDCGSRTINLCVLEDGKVQKLQTIGIGSFDFYSQIKNEQNSKGNDYQEEDIQRLIKDEVIKVYQKSYSDFLEQILNAIKPYCNYRTYHVYFTGGTSLLLKDYIDKLNLPRYEIMDDPLNSNVKGAKAAAEMIWGMSV